MNSKGGSRARRGPGVRACIRPRGVRPTRWRAHDRVGSKVSVVGFDEGGTVQVVSVRGTPQPVTRFEGLG